MPSPESCDSVSVPVSSAGLSPLKTFSVSTWSVSLTRVFRFSGLTTYLSQSPAWRTAARVPPPGAGHGVAKNTCVPETSGA